MYPKNSPDVTPKVHFVGFSFIWYLSRISKHAVTSGAIPVISFVDQAKDDDLDFRKAISSSFISPSSSLPIPTVRDGSDSSMLTWIIVIGKLKSSYSVQGLSWRAGNVKSGMLSKARVVSWRAGNVKSGMLSKAQPSVSSESMAETRSQMFYREVSAIHETMYPSLKVVCGHKSDVRSGKAATTNQQFGVQSSPCIGESMLDTRAYNIGRSSQLISTAPIVTPDTSKERVGMSNKYFPLEERSDFARLEHLRFNGDRITEWLFQIEQFFLIDRTPEELKVGFASLHFDDTAATLHQSIVQSMWWKHVRHDWWSYKLLLQVRYDEHVNDSIAKLTQLQETEGIEEYHARFELISTRLNFAEDYLVSVYLAGLRTDTQLNVRMFGPQTIQQCLMLGRLYEMAHPKSVLIRKESDDYQKEAQHVSSNAAGTSMINDGNCMIGNDGDRFLSGSDLVENAVATVKKYLVEIDDAMSSDDDQNSDAGDVFGFNIEECETDSWIEHKPLIQDQAAFHSIDIEGVSQLQKVRSNLKDFDKVDATMNQMLSSIGFVVDELHSSCGSATVHVQKKPSKSLKSWKFKFKTSSQDQGDHESLPIGLHIRFKSWKFKFVNRNLQMMREHGYTTHFQLMSDKREHQEMFIVAKIVDVRCLLSMILGITESDAGHGEQFVYDRITMVKRLLLQTSLVIQEVMRNKKIKFTKRWWFKYKFGEEGFTRLNSFNLRMTYHFAVWHCWKSKTMVHVEMSGDHWSWMVLVMKSTTSSFLSLLYDRRMGDPSRHETGREIVSLRVKFTLGSSWRAGNVKSGMLSKARVVSWRAGNVKSGMLSKARVFIEKSLGEYREKIPSEIAKEIEDAVADLRSASSGDDLNEIKAKIEAANKAVSKIGEHMSGGSGGGSAPGGGSEGRKCLISPFL
ncbi:Retrotransposon gag domain [Arabidopsis suecica]|uniref:Retrotransposon gag domain n=1 Tax=Arabidopsis suecica TaxID=45249 RepID=A0A8T2EJQ7_ARASU|nr:Retrotransposon gag domain [Arabidopsis suecica]